LNVRYLIYPLPFLAMPATANRGRHFFPEFLFGKISDLILISPSSRSYISGCHTSVDWTVRVITSPAADKQEDGSTG
jgi:hypothetical protein